MGSRLRNWADRIQWKRRNSSQVCRADAHGACRCHGRGCPAGTLVKPPTSSVPLVWMIASSGSPQRDHRLQAGWCDGGEGSEFHGSGVHRDGTPSPRPQHCRPPAKCGRPWRQSVLPGHQKSRDADNRGSAQISVSPAPRLRRTDCCRVGSCQHQCWIVHQDNIAIASSDSAAVAILLLTLVSSTLRSRLWRRSCQRNEPFGSAIRRSSQAPRSP